MQEFLYVRIFNGIFIVFIVLCFVLDLRFSPDCLREGVKQTKDQLHHRCRFSGRMSSARLVLLCSTLLLILLSGSTAAFAFVPCRSLPKHSSLIHLFTSVDPDEESKSSHPSQSSSEPFFGSDLAQDTLKGLNLDDISRRDAIILGAGGVAYGKLLGDALSRLGRGDAYPEAHETRVSQTFRAALREAASALTSARPLRVLEVGIGSECRTVKRGLYADALADVRLHSATGFELVGVDVVAPKAEAVERGRNALSRLSLGGDFTASFNAHRGDITSTLPYPTNYFDAVTCCLTLCSVSNQTAALQEISRLVNTDGGTFGYVEHVAVRLSEGGEESKRKILEWQQRTLDPIQNIVGKFGAWCLLRALLLLPFMWALYSPREILLTPL